MADKDFGVRGLNLIGQTGTPTIISPNNLTINATTVAISTDISIGGKFVSNIVVSNSYSVGIGTTVLTEKLNIGGNANISGVVSATGFVGSGVSLTGLLTNQSSTINTGEYQYLLVTPQTSGTISSVSSSYNYITFNPAAKYLGIGTNIPSAGLDVNGTGKFIGTVTAPTFQGTATTATYLADAANITTGIVSTARLSGTYNISISGNVATATTASGLTTTANVNTTGIITASSFTGNLTGTATTASGLTTTANVNTTGIITATKFVGAIEGTITGVADTAKQLQTTRYFSVNGDVSTGSSVAFDGTQNVGLAVTLALSGVTSGTYGSSTSIPSISVNSKGLITGVTTSGIVVGDGTLNLKTSGTGLSGIATFTANEATGTAVTFTVTSNATSTNTASSIVARDASGNFSAGTITGTATTASGLTATANVNTTGIITANTFSTGISTQNIGFTTGIISGPNTLYVYPYQIGISTGTVRILGNLQVDGTTVTTTQATIQSSATTIGVAVSETNNITLDGAGITIGSTSIQKTLLWNYGSSSLKSSENFNLANGKVYQINDNAILSSTTLASSVITAAGITTVGTLKQLVVSSNTTTDAVRITQIGSGNALVVEDDTNPDINPFVVNNIGYVGIGTTNPTYKLTISNNAFPTTGLSNAIADFTGSVDGYTQLNIRNSLSGASASSDLIATADTGSDTTNFIDLGINNSAFSSGSWTVNGALDGYLYTSDGSLSIGVATSNTEKYISFFTGGILAANEKVRINQTGVGIGTTNPEATLNIVPTSISIAGLFSGTTSNDMVRITQLGTGNALVVEDETSPDATPFVVTGIGSVGIGTNNPVTLLHISDGTGGISTALYTSDRLTISAQNTAPGFNIIAAGSAVAQRGVFKATRARGTLASPTVPLVDDNVFSLLGTIYDGSTGRATAAINMDVDGDVGVGTAPQRITFWTGIGTSTSRIERVRITSAGNVGIGTTNPTSKLYVYDPGATETHSQYISRTQTDFANGAAIGANINDYQTTSGARSVTGSTSAVRTSIGAGITNSGSIAGGYDSVFRNVDLSGDTGTLTNLFGRRIAFGHYNDFTGVFPTTTTATGLQITGYGYTGTITTLQGVNVSSFGVSAAATITNAYGLRSQIATNDATNAYNLYIDGSAKNYIAGSIGIGTTNPTVKLDVVGDAKVSGIITASSFVGNLTGTATTATTANNVSSSININTSGIITASSFVGNLTGTATTANNVSSTIDINTSGIITASSFVGNLTGTATTANNVSSTIDINTSGIITATDFNSTSDINLKTNIKKIDDCLSKVIQIRGVTFDWKETNKSSAGVIAQEVEKVLPELVNGEDIKTVNYNGVIGTLVEAVKELKAENDILKEKLEEIYKKVFS